MGEERVMFTLEAQMLADDRMEKLLLTVFDICLPLRRGFQTWEGVDIICRLDQFARFIILRNQLGISNQTKHLNAKLIPDPSIPIRRIYNVTTNNNKEPSDD